MFKKILPYLFALEEIIFPTVCFFCQEKIKKGILCDRCFKRIKFLPTNTCFFCATTITKKIICKECLQKKFPYERLIACTYYEEPLVTLISFFKYKNFNFLGEFLSSLIISYLEKINFNINDYQYITYVPLHPIKLREREYNQTEILTNFLAKKLNLIVLSDIIYTSYYRPSQTKFKEREREKNVKGIFKINRKVNLENIILVDDVFTTGATIRECASTLKEAGIKKIITITLCKS